MSTQPFPPQSLGEVPNHAPKEVPFHQKFIVGAVAGIFGTSIVYPMDIMKTQLQSRKAIAGESLLSATVSAFRRIVSSNGYKGLYRGFSSCLVGIAPEKAIKLAVNDFMRDYFTSSRSVKRDILIHEQIIAGSVAGFVQLVVTVPYEMVKIRLQLQGDVAPELRLSAKQIIANLGIGGIYRGFTATVARDVPFCFIFFPLYSTIKNIQTDLYRQYSDPLKTAQNFQDELAATKEPFFVGLTAGLLSGAIAGAIVTPADMLKTRIQQGLAGDQGFIAFGRHVVQQEGASSLFRGWHTRVLVIAPLYGIISLAFELQKQWLSEHQ